MTWTAAKIKSLHRDFRAARKIPHCLPAPESCDAIEAALEAFADRLAADERRDAESPRHDNFGPDPFGRPQ